MRDKLDLGFVAATSHKDALKLGDVSFLKLWDKNNLGKTSLPISSLEAAFKIEPFTTLPKGSSPFPEV